MDSLHFIFEITFISVGGYVTVCVGWRATVNSVLVPCGFQESRLGHPDWKQAPLPTRPLPSILFCWAEPSLLGLAPQV